MSGAPKQPLNFQPAVACNFDTNSEAPQWRAYSEAPQRREYSEAPQRREYSEAPQRREYGYASVPRGGHKGVERGGALASYSLETRSAETCWSAEDEEYDLPCDFCPVSCTIA
jgi:hypothetical protein